MQASAAHNLKYHTSFCYLKLRLSSFLKITFLSFQSLSPQRNLVSARKGGQAGKEVSQMEKQVRRGRGAGNILAP